MKTFPKYKKADNIFTSDGFETVSGYALLQGGKQPTQHIRHELGGNALRPKTFAQGVIR
jgi:hypothetical protein